MHHNPPQDAADRTPKNAWMENFRTPEGHPRPVTKVVFELVGHGWRWTVWSESRLLVSFPVTDLNDLLTATSVFVDPERAMDPRYDAVCGSE